MQTLMRGTGPHWLLNPVKGYIFNMISKNNCDVFNIFTFSIFHVIDAGFLGEIGIAEMF